MGVFGTNSVECDLREGAGCSSRVDSGERAYVVGFQVSSESIAPPIVLVDFCHLKNCEGETPLTRPDFFARAP